MSCCRFTESPRSWLSLCFAPAIGASNSIPGHCVLSLFTHRQPIHFQIVHHGEVSGATLIGGSLFSQ